jgi:hypothetical protein
VIAKLDSFVKKGPHLSVADLEKLKTLEEERNNLAKFLYSIQDGLGYILEFLLSHFERDDISFQILDTFQEFLPPNHYLKPILKTSNIEIWKLNEGLIKFDSISEKLDYWKQNYYDRFKSEQKFFNPDGTFTNVRKSPYAKSNINEIVFSEFECESVISPALIPNSIYRIHFKNGLQDASFTYWFLKFNAENWAEEYYISSFYRKRESSIVQEFVESEMNKIEELEYEATQDLIKQRIDIYSQPTSNSQDYSIELKRIQADYYRKNVLLYPHLKGGNSPVDIFAKHVFYKSFLEGLVDKHTLDGSVEGFKEKGNRFREIFVKIIENMSRKVVAFKDEDSYRSHFYHAFGSHPNIHVSAEEISRAGRTDLMLKGELGTQIVEFKIWNRNDYKNITEQVEGYLNDFDNTGYIFMANKSKKKKIDDEYLALLNSYLSLKGEVKIHQVRETSYVYYESIHEYMGRTKQLYHYIYNDNQ